MPVFISSKPMGRMSFGDRLYTSWRRWFAWYPVTEMNRTYWLVAVEWRHVRSSGWLAENSARLDYVEYRLPQEQP